MSDYVGGKKIQINSDSFVLLTDLRTGNYNAAFFKSGKGVIAFVNISASSIDEADENFVTKLIDRMYEAMDSYKEYINDLASLRYTRLLADGNAS